MCGGPFAQVRTSRVTLSADGETPALYIELGFSLDRLHCGGTDRGWWFVWHFHADDSPAHRLFQHRVPARRSPFYVQQPEGRRQIAEHTSDDPFDIVLFHMLTRRFTY